MSFQKNPPTDPELAALISQAVEKTDCYPDGAWARWLLVDTARQRLILVRESAPERSWSVSTAAAGLDNRQDSRGTPPGAHRIAEKIGAGCPAGTVFDSRRETGRIWRTGDPTDDGTDLILTRILTLEGCEPGFNQGPGVDSRTRYIYLHGTNDEGRIGQPVSHGCVRLTNADICEVFDLVSEGDPVVIL